MSKNRSASKDFDYQIQNLKNDKLVSNLENLGFPSEQFTIEINPKNCQKSAYIKDKKAFKANLSSIT